MSAYLAGALVLLVGALGPACLLGTRGDPVDRLIGLELGGIAAALVLMSLAQALGRPSYLIVPLALALLSFAGTLVFTRLLAPRS